MESSQTYLNGRDLFAELTVVSRRELGLIGRVSLIFSRRGMDISEMAFTTHPSNEVSIKLQFWADTYQVRCVAGDLEKLYAVQSVSYEGRPWRTQLKDQNNLSKPSLPSEGCL